MSQGSESVHTPVLVPAVLRALGDETSTLEGWIVDGTLGAGGHARALLEAHPGVRLFGIDQDPDALTIAKLELVSFRDRVRLERGRISQLEELLLEADLGPDSPIVGCLFDLGANSLHFDRAERGFSFQADGPLDMRMDPSRQRTAADIINNWDESDLADLFYYEGGERRSRRIARAIVEGRDRVPFLRTFALAELIARTVGAKPTAKIHPATRCFQALRRAVNEEGEELIRGLKIAERILSPGGRLAVISFHSGEDRIVKRFLLERARQRHWQLATKKPIEPEAAERRANPRARSARLRCAERLHSQPLNPGPFADRRAPQSARRERGGGGE